MIDFETFLKGLEEYRKNEAFLNESQLKLLYIEPPSSLQSAPPVASSAAVVEQTSNFQHHKSGIRDSVADMSARFERNDNERNCAFCISNKERPELYRTHALKDSTGRVTCPVLRAYVCPQCSATGDKAHTIRYCPRTAVGTRTSSFLRTNRNSAGRIIRQQKF